MDSSMSGNTINPVSVPKSIPVIDRKSGVLSLAGKNGIREFRNCEPPSNNIGRTPSNIHNIKGIRFHFLPVREKIIPVTNNDPHKAMSRSHKATLYPYSSDPLKLRASSGSM
jgi:hypothetical protein